MKGLRAGLDMHSKCSIGAPPDHMYQQPKASGIF